MSPTAFDAPRPRPTPISLWRALPFTAQLLVVGMIVGFTWFIASRTAAERQQGGALARNADLVRLQRAEVLASGLGASLHALSRSHRGFLLTGEESHLRELREDSLAFDLGSARLLEVARSQRVATDLAELRGSLLRWHDLAVVPNISLRRRAGLAAFDMGRPGAEGIRLGAQMMDGTLRLHERMMTDLRDEVRYVELLVEEAATRDDLTTFLTSTGGLAVLILLLALLMRLVRRALDQVVQAAQALDAGRYADARLPAVSSAPNREMAVLSATFGQLAETTARREQQLQEDIVKLRELERLKRDFVSTVSHELRTPLTSMRGAIGLILGGKVGEVPAKGRDLLQIAMTNTERLIRLINDILDIEKIDAGHASVRRDMVRLRPLLETTIAGVESFAREHGVRVALLSGAEGDADLVGDSDRLIQVFTNLLSNAAKFSPAGSEVEVRAAVDGEQVTVRVRDHGPGIAPEFAARIFGRFQQAGGAESRPSGGTGLGLNIARSIVELHGGRIGFEPAEGGGTVFWVALPRVTPVAPLVPAESRPDVRRAVLIVEDDTPMREVLMALIDPIARAVPVRSAEAALEVLAREPIAAIILDAGLPGIDGFGLARQVRQDPKLRTMPVYLFSAQEFPAETLRAAGIRAADAYVKTRDSEAVLFERLRHQLAKVT